MKQQMKKTKMRVVASKQTKQSPAAKVAGLKKQMLQYTYTARKGSPYSDADAKKIAPVLIELAKQNGGMVTPKMVLEAARNPDSPLYEFFEWDDAVAAEKYRMILARQIIKSIHYNVKTGKVVVDIGAFQRITNAGELPDADEGSGYVTTPTVIEHVEFERQVLEQAMRELKSFQARYKTLSDTFTVFKPLFVAIAKIEKVVAAKAKSA